MPYYRGIFGDMFENCEAETEAEAQKIMLDRLKKYIEETPDCFTVWEIEQDEYRGDD